MPKQRDVQPDFSNDEISRRRDAVIHRMANTPPQPKNQTRLERKKKADADRGVRKDRAGREL